MNLLACLALGSPATLEGIVFGKAVLFDHVEVRKLAHRASARSGNIKDEADVYVFTFQRGNELMYDTGIKFHVNVSVGTKLEKAKLVQPSLKFGTPEHSKYVHGSNRAVSCGRGALAAFIDGDGRMESANDQIKFKFFCKPLQNGQYKASIFAYNSEFRSGVQGNFVFKLETN